MLGKAVSKPWGVQQMPEISYIICTTPRSGSTLLCEALWRTGLAGRPQENFLYWHLAAHNPDGLKSATAQPWLLPPDAYMRKLFEAGSTANGVFGVKIMGLYFDVVINQLRPLAPAPHGAAADILASVLPKVHYIYLRRRDKVRQAVSWVKALQTDHWHDAYQGDVAARPDDASPQGLQSHREQGQGKRLVYDFDQLMHYHGALLAQEERWEAFFQAAALQPYRVFYEDFVQSYGRIVSEILDYLHIPHPAPVWKPASQWQSDTVNAEWTQRFTAELAQQSSPGMFKKIMAYFIHRRPGRHSSTDKSAGRERDARSEYDILLGGFAQHYRLEERTDLHRQINVTISHILKRLANLKDVGFIKFDREADQTPHPMVHAKNAISKNVAPMPQSMDASSLSQEHFRTMKDIMFFPANDEVVKSLECISKSLDIQNFIQEYFRIMKIVFHVLQDRGDIALKDNILTKLDHACEMVAAHPENQTIMQALMHTDPVLLVKIFKELSVEGLIQEMQKRFG